MFHVRNNPEVYLVIQVQNLGIFLFPASAIADVLESKFTVVLQLVPHSYSILYCGNIKILAAVHFSLS